MPWRYFGSARADANSPRAAGYCDRCNFLYNLQDLKWQYEYRGVGEKSIHLRVCSKCMDVPNPQFKAITLPADPVPVRDPRPGNVTAQMNNSSPVETWDQEYGRWDDGISEWL